MQIWLLKDNESSLHVLCFISGDQISSKDGQNLFIYASDVVQVSAAALLRPVVHLPAWVRRHLPLEGSGSAYGLRCAQEDAGQEVAGSRRGGKSTRQPVV